MNTAQLAGGFDQGPPEQQDGSQPPESVEQGQHADGRDGDHDRPTEGRRQQCPHQQVAGGKAVCQRAAGEIGPHGNDAIQGKRGTELKVGDAENIDECGTENPRQDKGQQKDGLTGNDEGGERQETGISTDSAYGFLNDRDKNTCFYSSGTSRDRTPENGQCSSRKRECSALGEFGSHFDKGSSQPVALRRSPAVLSRPRSLLAYIV